MITNKQNRVIHDATTNDAGTETGAVESGAPPLAPVSAADPPPIWQNRDFAVTDFGLEFARARTRRAPDRAADH